MDSMNPVTKVKQTIETITQSTHIEELVEQGLDDSLLYQYATKATPQPAPPPDENMSLNASPARAGAGASPHQPNTPYSESSPLGQQAQPAWLIPPDHSVCALEHGPRPDSVAEDCWECDDDCGFTEVLVPMAEFVDFTPDPIVPEPSEQQQEEQQEEQQPQHAAAADADEQLQSLIGQDDEEEDPEPPAEVSYNVRVVFDKNKLMFNPGEELEMQPGDVVGQRYRCLDRLGEGAFSYVLVCEDLRRRRERVAVKCVRNDKTKLDQSLMEIQTLRTLNSAATDPDKSRVVRVLDFFYYAQHLFIVTELLQQDLYVAYVNAEQGNQKCAQFLQGAGNLQRITRQIFEGLAFVHAQGFVHGDIKPENVVVKSYSGVKVKLIDFGSAAYVHEKLPDYAASRPYRSAESLLGRDYDGRHDVWSAAAVVFELLTNGRVLFEATTQARLLARIAALRGPFPRWMIEQGRAAHKYFRGDYLFEDAHSLDDGAEDPAGNDARAISVLFPRPCALGHRVFFQDPLFEPFLEFCLNVDPRLRPTAAQVLEHPWLDL
jgi:serine/threonine protein kinase